MKINNVLTICYKNSYTCSYKKLSYRGSFAVESLFAANQYQTVKMTWGRECSCIIKGKQQSSIKNL